MAVLLYGLQSKKWSRWSEVGDSLQTVKTPNAPAVLQKVK